MYKTFNSDRVMQWRLYIEEYSPDLQYIKGEKNVVADALSRLDMDGKPSLYEALITEEMCSDWYCYAKEEQTFDSHPLSYQHIEKAQCADKSLKKILHMDNSPYQMHSFHGGGITRELICRNGKIVIPSLLQKHVIDWYHTVLCHPGMNRTEETISQHLWWPKMQEQITTLFRPVHAAKRTKENKRNMAIYHQKKQKLLYGIRCA